eukprot:CAMPEP_0194142488 /NCGR_PEP_ID=MMETSP0152-20130528/11729_1 /TAXON_ID=1049557 /ORGANISM="Thalassiothrix antarctica, Strain L6-D1" /LENGTH=196 /DNA_ID=CAMNT_0038841445 /DNA_START=111 /DNA_END=701 /DNA_ORIENTATION=+
MSQQQQKEKTIAVPPKLPAGGNSKNTNGGELLLRAAQRNETSQIYDLITTMGVPPSYGNGIGQTALHVAVLWGHMDCVDMLLQLGANVNAANSMMGMTPLHTVLGSTKLSYEVKEQIVLILLDAGADTGMEDQMRNRPIEYIPKNHPNQQLLREKLKPPKRNAGELLLKDVIGSVSVCRLAPPPEDDTLQIIEKLL